MDKRKEEIVEVALRRFKHFGFGKTSMNEIADDLGITKANLYYYYPDKTALVKDVVCHVSGQLLNCEQDMVNNYNGDFLGTLFDMLELRADHMRNFYMLCIHEDYEWMKKVELGDFIKELKDKDKQVLLQLFTKAVADKKLKLDMVEDSCEVYLDIVRGISMSYTAQDVMTGIPNVQNVDCILESQKKATELIFKEKIYT